MNEMEQQFYNCKIGSDYPSPIVNIEETRKYASDIVWSFRKKDEVKGIFPEATKLEASLGLKLKVE